MVQLNGGTSTSHSQGTEQATRFWLTPACPSQRTQVLSALMALGNIWRGRYTQIPYLMSNSMLPHPNPQPALSSLLLILTDVPLPAPQVSSLCIWPQVPSSTPSGPCLSSALDPSPPYICLVPSASRLGTTMQQTRRTQESIFSSILGSTLRPHKLPPSRWPV